MQFVTKFKYFVLLGTGHSAETLFHSVNAPIQKEQPIPFRSSDF